MSGRTAVRRAASGNRACANDDITPLFRTSCRLLRSTSETPRPFIPSRTRAPTRSTTKHTRNIVKGVKGGQRVKRRPPIGRRASRPTGRHDELSWLRTLIHLPVAENPPPSPTTTIGVRKRPTPRGARERARALCSVGVTGSRTQRVAIPLTKPERV